MTELSNDTHLTNQKICSLIYRYSDYPHVAHPDLATATHLDECPRCLSRYSAVFHEEMSQKFSDARVREVVEMARRRQPDRPAHFEPDILKRYVVHQGQFSREQRQAIKQHLVFCCECSFVVHLERMKPKLGHLLFD